MGRGFLDIYPGQQIIGDEMQNAPQEETHDALGNTLDAGRAAFVQLACGRP